jgi:hypothetical protein
MHLFIAGATGATGKLLTEELLKRGHSVTAVVRSVEKLSYLAGYSDQLNLIEREILSLETSELAEILASCDGAASCLGHNLTLKGLFGPPRRLVTDAAGLILSACRDAHREKPLKFVLMNTTGNRNRREVEEVYRRIDRLVLGFFTRLLPPQADNEEAARLLQQSISADDRDLAWCAVRPDTLIDEPLPSPREIHISPVRSPVFNAGKTSRINVACFMADLLEDGRLWEKWAGKMPVIYNAPATGPE